MFYHEVFRPWFSGSDRLCKITQNMGIIQIAKLLLNRNTLIIALIALVVLLFGWVHLERSGRIEAEKGRSEATQLLNNEKAVTKFYINSNGEQIAKVKQMEIGQTNLKELVKSQQLNFISQFQGLKKDFNNLERAVELNGHIDFDSIRVVPFQIPSDSKAFRWSLKDKYNDIDMIVLDTPKIAISVPLDLIVNWERKKFLGLRIGKKSYFTQVASKNKLVKIDSVSSFTFRKR